MEPQKLSREDWNRHGQCQEATQGRAVEVASTAVGLPPAAQQPSGTVASERSSVPRHAEPYAAPAVASADTKECRRRQEFRLCQQRNLEQRVCPAKTPQEVDEEEKHLFSRDAESWEAVGSDFGLYDTITCEVKGSHTEALPQVNSFSDICEQFAEEVPQDLQRNIERCRFELPTPVQKYAIPVALSGRDVMCCAQTGSGKTVAFLIPVLASMIKHHRATGSLTEPFAGPCRPDTLIIAPTRELCSQIHRETLRLCHRTPFRAIQVYGGGDIHTQMEDAAKGADVVVATPGRLWDFVHSGIIGVWEVNCLVIDEADIIISFHMEAWVRAIVEQHGMPAKQNRQTLMFSATFPSEIRQLASDYLYDYVWLAVGPVGSAACTVVQDVVRVTPEERFDRLLAVVDDFLDGRSGDERMIIFTNSRAAAKRLDELLWNSKVDTGALHGDLPQADRTRNLQEFREGHIDVLVATDVASRGLDIVRVTHVVNYELPRDIDCYVQRIGRTGRIGHRGFATTFITVSAAGDFKDDRVVLRDLEEMLRKSKCEVPDWLAGPVASWRVSSTNGGSGCEEEPARDSEPGELPKEQDGANVVLAGG